mgnify:CR=1 FL=1
MKKFLQSLFIFCLPAIIAFVITLAVYEPSGNDISRLGKISFKKTYRNDLMSTIPSHSYFNEITSFPSQKKIETTVFTIGDSFSKQRLYGYQNYMAKMNDISVIDFHLQLEQNPFTTLEKIVESHYIDQLNVRFICLEIVERHFVKNIIQSSKTQLNIHLENLRTPKNPTPKQKLLTDILKFPLFSLLYFFDDNAFVSPVYKFELTQPLFSTKPTQLFVYKNDISSIRQNTDENIKAANKRLNHLAKKLKTKGIQLIVLPAPDKYDVYEPFIKNNTLGKNLFFDFLMNQERDYIVINSKKHLQKAVQKKEMDIYWADDTHWSPKGSQIIAAAVYQQIAKANEKALKSLYNK